MKYVGIFIFFCILFSCWGQEKTPIKPEEMYTTEKFNIEKFNIEKFNKNRIVSVKDINSDSSEPVYIKDTLSDISDTLTDGSVINRSLWNLDKGIEYTEEVIPPIPSMFSIYKIFYSDGKLKTKYTKMSLLRGYIPSGIEYNYNEKGELTKKIDHDQLYKEVKVTLDRLFDILDKEGIYKKDIRKNQIVSVFFHNEDTPWSILMNLSYKKGENPFWEVYKEFYLHDGNPPFAKVYKIDALTEKVEEVETFNIE